MHPGKLRDWGQENTKLVFVWLAAGTASGPKHYSISELSALTLYFVHCKNMSSHIKHTKCSNALKYHVDWYSMRWKMKYGTITIYNDLFYLPVFLMDFWTMTFLKTFFIPWRQNVKNLEFKVSTVELRGIILGSCYSRNLKLDWRRMNILCVQLSW